uniref:Uncharacterized protein n=1 Tax=Lepeophtheirus salmonis TaxID=72036 RepID=A0A0K2TML0_LEPSM
MSTDNKNIIIQTPVGDDKSAKYSFDNILDIVGSFGRWQICALLLSTLSGFICAFNHLGGLFLAYTPDTFYCEERHVTGQMGLCLDTSTTLNRILSDN